MLSKEQHDSSMTIYFSKNTGEIKGFATGIQDMSFYGDNEVDFSIIWDYLVIDYDKQLLGNIEKFIVNVEDGTIELLPEHAFRPEQYKIAGGD